MSLSTTLLVVINGAVSLYALILPRTGRRTTRRVEINATPTSQKLFRAARLLFDVVPGDVVEKGTT